MNKISTFLIITFSFSLLPYHQLFSQQSHNFMVIAPGIKIEQLSDDMSKITPTWQQFEWQKMEFIAFAHFGMNTFTDKEWGEGTEDPSLFDPTSFNAEQWAQTFRAAGMRMLIIVAKHHDGFCYWPSKFTTHSVKKSPWKKGKGDIVGELVKACRENGLKVGIYLSPWDRHEKTYGNTPEYNKFFINQLKELLTNYGAISEVWFDGACAEGPNGKKQEYDWASYFKTVRQLQPGALIFGMGPDIRWVGNEAGSARESEWSVVPVKVKNTTQLQVENSLDNVFLPGDLTQDDLGSLDEVIKSQVVAWYPAEADVSIRPGWFYHQKEDGMVKTPEQLFDLYFSTVGRNSVLLLNVPPDKRGLIPDADARSLIGLRSFINQTFEINLADKALFTYLNPESDKPYFVSSNKNINWQAKEEADSSILNLALPNAKSFDVVMLQESIQKGQRIEKFRLDFFDGKEWKTFSHGTTIGYKRLLRFPAITTNQIRLVIEKSRGPAKLCMFGLYKLPSSLEVKK